MTWLFFCILASVSCSAIEYIYRLGAFQSFVIALPYIFLPVLLAQGSLFYAFKLGPGLLIIGAIFTVVNAFIRLGTCAALHEHIYPVNYLGIVLLCTGTVLLKMKGRI